MIPCGYHAHGTTSPTLLPLDVGKWEPKSAPELTWTNAVHPQFKEATELDRARRRYDVGLAGLCYTIPRVKDQPEFRATIQELRKRGWKDWHVLSAMGALNFLLRTELNE